MVRCANCGNIIPPGFPRCPYCPSETPANSNEQQEREDERRLERERRQEEERRREAERQKEEDRRREAERRQEEDRGREAEDRQEEEQRQKDTKFGWVGCGILALVFVIGLVGLIAICGGGDSDNDDQAGRLTDAASGSQQSSPVATMYPTYTPFPSPTHIPTYTPFPAPTPMPTYTPFPSPTPMPTYTPFPNATPFTTYTPFPSPTPFHTQTPTPTATPIPAYTPTPVPSAAVVGCHGATIRFKIGYLWANESITWETGGAD